MDEYVTIIKTNEDKKRERERERKSRCLFIFILVSDIHYGRKKKKEENIFLGQ